MGAATDSGAHQGLMRLKSANQRISEVACLFCTNDVPSEHTRPDVDPTQHEFCDSGHCWFGSFNSCLEHAVPKVNSSAQLRVEGCG